VISRFHLTDGRRMGRYDMMYGGGYGGYGGGYGGYGGGYGRGYGYGGYSYY
jgi:hypothetical protein